MDMERILIIDNEARALKTLDTHLYNAGFSLITTLDGLSGLKSFYDHHPELVILDLSTSGMDGWTVVSRIREVSATPIIVLSAIHAEKDKLRAFSLGADDYMTKPFSCAEMVARVKALLKRINGNVVDHNRASTTGDLTIDLARRRVTRKGEIVNLTPREFRLLATLVRHKGRPISHEYLLDSVWGSGYEGETSYIKRYVWALRKKLEDNPASPSHILTERGYGYCFD
jgi:two-component system KDP operon response regulator KdpE